MRIGIRSGPVACGLSGAMLYAICLSQLMGQAPMKEHMTPASLVNAIAGPPAAIVSAPERGRDVSAGGTADILWQDSTGGDLWIWHMYGPTPVAAEAINGATTWRVPCTGDFNGDGKADILWQEPTTGDLWVWFMDGSTHTGQAPISGSTTWRVVGAGDFD
jgi:hypothetical protein